MSLELARTLALVAGDVERRGLSYAGVLRRAARALADVGEPSTAGCPRCRAPVDRKPTGRPARYCSPRCRKAAWRERNRDAMRPSPP